MRVLFESCHLFHFISLKISKKHHCSTQGIFVLFWILKQWIVFFIGTLKYKKIQPYSEGQRINIPNVFQLQTRVSICFELVFLYLVP